MREATHLSPGPAGRLLARVDALFDRIYTSRYNPLLQSGPIAVGAGLSALIFLLHASADAKLVELRESEQGVEEHEPPVVLEPDRASSRPMAPPMMPVPMMIASYWSGMWLLLDRPRPAECGGGVEVMIFANEWP